MPVYRYAHENGDSCEMGDEFELKESIKAERLKICPNCKKPLQLLIPRNVSFVSTRSNAELKNLGMTKLVRRDSGVYENVTAQDGEKRIVDANED